MLTLVGFAASVILIRLFFNLTGYPQVGNGELHVAHVLCGGLLLFAASLLLLLFVNRWAYTAGVLSAGVGVGLFIDEVGKFITQNNDYFFPAAAPIIYAFFLLIVMLYLQVRRPRPRDARAELYYALEAFGEVLDRDLDAQERHELDARLQRAIREISRADKEITQLSLRPATTLLPCSSIYFQGSRTEPGGDHAQGMIMEDRRYADRSSRSVPLSDRLSAAKLSFGVLMLKILLANLRDPHVLWPNLLAAFRWLPVSVRGADLGCYSVSTFPDTRRLTHQPGATHLAVRITLIKY